LREFDSTSLHELVLEIIILSHQKTQQRHRLCVFLQFLTLPPPLVVIFWQLNVWEQIHTRRRGWCHDSKHQLGLVERRLKGQVKKQGKHQVCLYSPIEKTKRNSAYIPIATPRVTHEQAEAHKPLSIL
jgi:hypothetical protein